MEPFSNEKKRLAKGLNLENQCPTLGTLTELTTNYGYPTNAIARGSKLRHTDDKNGFSGIKECSSEILVK